MKDLNWVYVPKPAPVSYQELLLSAPYKAKHIHMHDTHEINLIRSENTVELQFNGARCVVKTPALLLQKKGSFHEILHSDGPFDSRVIYFDPEAVRSVNPRLLYEEQLFVTSLGIVPLTFAEAESFLPYFDLIRDDEGERRLFSLFSVLHKIAQRHSDEILNYDTKNSYIFEAIRSIQDHPEEEMSIQSLSLQFHVSATKFKEDLKKITGYSVKRFVLHHRLRRALTLLTNTRLPLAQIALQCGFSGESHLIRAFRAEFGVTPGAFRKNNNN